MVVYLGALVYELKSFRVSTDGKMWNWKAAAHYSRWSVTMRQDHGQVQRSPHIAGWKGQAIMNQVSHRSWMAELLLSICVFEILGVSYSFVFGEVSEIKM